MGVSGSGKSTVGRGLAAVLGARFVEGDQLHPPENVARMRAGRPLTDADRQGWLVAVAQQLADAALRGEALVVSCSALRRSYRERLRAAAPELKFVYLHGTAELLAARMASRRDHYMPASLLQSQLETLEPPAGDEGALAFDVAEPAATIVARIVQQLQTVAP